ncbi:uncharacterized protein LOC121257863 [Juglans microcarpa x Juglans regia]|uniref:uncharacterized protein LOC121257863 n=1 Tax=Juglans microcarpa x Juglans regia TaxID=2249226 RepID=UPI001B7E99A6|nr:uncharacterized protein LOC121257863 [Juglans microcarpa x Juglans regia]
MPMIMLWITAIVACILLFSAASHSDEREPAETRYDGNSYEGFSTTIKHYCPVVKPGIFASGAVLSLVSSILGIACIALTSRSSRADTPTLDNPSDDPKQGGQGEIIAIGEPQFTPKNNNAQQPV